QIGGERADVLPPVGREGGELGGRLLLVRGDLDRLVLPRSGPGRVLGHGGGGKQGGGEECGRRESAHRTPPGTAGRRTPAAYPSGRAGQAGRHPTSYPVNGRTSAGCAAS